MQNISGFSMCYHFANGCTPEILLKFQLTESADDSGLQFEITVFDDMIQLFDRLRHDMMKSVVDHVFTDVKARSKPYRDDRYSYLRIT